MSTKNPASDSFKSNRPFYDDRNYPKGISRSGDYSLKEAQLLEKHGAALLELANGKRQPINQEEKDFIAVCNAEKPAESFIEKAWLKYQNKVLSPKQFHTLFGRTKVQGESDDSPSDETIDLEIS